MPDSTSGTPSSGHEAPAIQLDDKVDISDAYSFKTNGNSDDRAEAFIDADLGGDTLVGDAGNDTIRGWTSDDTAVLDLGDDSFPVDAGNDTIRGWTGDDTAVVDADNVNKAEVADAFDLISVETAKRNLNGLGKVESETGSANTSPPFDGSASVDVPAGFPNGRRFGDDLIDIVLRAGGSGMLPPQIDMGSSAGFSNEAAGSGYPFDDGLYEINLNPPTMDAGSDPAGRVGAGFADDDPEYHGDGELIL